MHAAVGGGEVHGGRTNNRHCFIAATMPFGGIEFGMHSLVRKVKEEWLVAVERVQPIERIGCQQVSCITSLWLLHLCAIDVERGRVIHTLVAEAYPLVEPRLRITVFITHVPFAEEAGFVTFLLHKIGRASCRERVELQVVGVRSERRQKAK